MLGASRVGGNAAALCECPLIKGKKPSFERILLQLSSASTAICARVQQAKDRREATVQGADERRLREEEEEEVRKLVQKKLTDGIR